MFCFPIVEVENVNVMNRGASEIELTQLSAKTRVEYYFLFSIFYFLGSGA